MSRPTYLEGQMLIAMPGMTDPRFEHSLIYLCAHSENGAMGIIVNRPAGSIDFPELLVQLDIIKKADQSLYQAKQAGRNRGCAGEAIESGVVHAPI